MVASNFIFRENDTCLSALAAIDPDNIEDIILFNYFKLCEEIIVAVITHETIHGIMDVITSVEESDMLDNLFMSTGESIVLVNCNVEDLKLWKEYKK